MTELDQKLTIHVNRKTTLGTTETLGEIVFLIDNMFRYQPPNFFRLSKSSKDRGFIQLEYHFSTDPNAQFSKTPSIKSDKATSSAGSLILSFLFYSFIISQSASESRKETRQNQKQIIKRYPKQQIK